MVQFAKKLVAAQRPEWTGCVLRMMCICCMHMLSIDYG